MSNLKCHVYFCKFNDCMRCKHEAPNMNENAECVSYERKSLDRMKNPYQFEYAEDKRFSLNDDEHNICCKTCSCMNNVDKMCSLSNVRVDTKEDKAKCMNYRKKID